MNRDTHLHMHAHTHAYLHSNQEPADTLTFIAENFRSTLLLSMLTPYGSKGTARGHRLPHPVLIDY